MKGKTVGIIVVVCLVAIVLLMAAFVTTRNGDDDINETIEKTLVSTNLTYYSIAGKPLNYTIGTNDIVSIEPTTYEGSEAWKVRVGQGLSWDLTMDANGTKVLHVNQLFQT